MKPVLSVVIPIYNCEKYLERCINSVLSQTINNIEIILVNDGSTDNGLKICNEYAQKNANIIVLDQKNQGASSARINGIKKTSGDYITFLDSDDWIHPEMYGALLKTAEETESDIVQCSYIITSDENASIENRDEYFVKSFSNDNALSQLLCVSDDAYFNCLLWNKIYKREIFSRFDYPVEVKTINDVPVVLRAFYYAKKITATNREFVYYFSRNNENNLSIMDALKSDKRKTVFCHLEAYCNSAVFFKSVDKEIYLKSLRLCSSWLMSGFKIKPETEEQKSLLSKAIKLQYIKSEYISLINKLIITVFRLFY